MPLAALLLLLASAAHGAPAAGLDALATRLEGVADDLAGPGLVRVFLRVEPSAPGDPIRPEDGRQRNGPAAGGEPLPAALWDHMRERRGKTPPVLPGYSFPESLGEEAAAALASLQAGGPTLRWSLTVVAARSLAEEDLQSVLSAFKEILDFSPARGDRLRIVRAALRPRPAAGAPPPTPTESWLPWAALAALLVCGGGAFLLRGRPPGPLPASSGPMELPEAARVPEPSQSLPLPQRQSPLPAAGRGPVPPLPALDRRRADALAAALSRESGEGLSGALRAVDPELAAEVFRRLPPAKRREAARGLLASAGPLGPAEASALRDRLRRGLGGPASEEALEDILLRASEEDRTLVLRDLLAADPGRALALERRLPTLEGLAASDPAALRRALSLFSAREIAVLLGAASVEVRDAFAEALPALVREEVGRLAGTLPAAPPEEVQRLLGRLYGRWRRLEGASA